MKEFFKNQFKRLLLNNVLEIKKVRKKLVQDKNCFLACKSKIKTQQPIIFDIGMNHGQTLNKIMNVFNNPLIHGFEASKYCFRDLKNKFKNFDNIMLNNVAVAHEEGTLQFNEYSWDAMNSFLKRAYATAKIIESYDVKTTTIDAYCFKNKIDNINILKSDTEGFELKVLEGAKNMFSKNKIQFVFIELFFDLNFIGQSTVGEIFVYLENNNFSLVKFYDFSLTEEGLASKSDALFINNNFID